MTKRPEGSPIEEESLKKPDEDQLSAEFPTIEGGDNNPDEKSSTIQTPEDASVPFMITRGMEQRLSDLGWNKRDRNKLTPERANEILNNSEHWQTTKQKLSPTPKSSKIGTIGSVRFETPKVVSPQEEAAVQSVVEEIVSQLPSEKLEKKSVKDVVKNVTERIKTKKVFGIPISSIMKSIWDRKTEIAAGAAAGFATRTALKIALGPVSFIAGAGVGAVGGGVAGGAREAWRQRRGYKSFIKEVMGGDEKLDKEKVSQKLNELREAIGAEQDARKREGLKDQLRYLQVAIKREALQTIQPEDIGKWKRVEDHNRQALMSVVADIMNIQKEGQEELLKEILSSKLIDKQRLRGAILRGAAFGAVGGAVGGALADHFGWGGPTGAPKVPGATDTIEPKVPGVTETTMPSTTEVLPTPEITVPSTKLDDFDVKLVRPDDIDTGPDIAPDTIEFSPEIAALGTIKAPSGSTTWGLVSESLKKVLGRDPTEAEILRVTKSVAKESGIKVESWGLMEGIDHRALPVGFEIKLGSSTTKDLIQQIAEGKSPQAHIHEHLHKHIHEHLHKTPIPEVSPEIMPEILQVPRDSTVLNVVSNYLEGTLGEKPTENELSLVAKLFAEGSGFSGVDAITEYHSILPTDIDFRITPLIKESIQGLIDSPSISEKISLGLPQELISLPKGSNGLTVIKDTLKGVLGRDPTNSELIKVTRAIAKESGFEDSINGIAEWGSSEAKSPVVLDRDVNLKFSLKIKGLIQRIFEASKK